MFDLDPYLARIRLPARPSPDALGLQALQRAHRLAIPFENLDAVLGRGVRIDSAAVFAKLVGRARGGYCFEHNRLFGDALAALRFAARPLMARVLLGDPPAMPGKTHTLSLVTIDEQGWIADPGFGGSYAPVLPLVDGAEATAPDGARFRLMADEGGWLLLRDGPAGATDGRGTGAGWQSQYRFTLAEVHEADLEMANHWVATAPDSRLARTAVCSIVLPHGFASLTDRAYRRRAGEEESAGEITDPRVYRMRLSLMFGIDLSAEEVTALKLF